MVSKKRGDEIELTENCKVYNKKPTNLACLCVESYETKMQGGERLLQ